MGSTTGDWMVHFQHHRCEAGYEWEPMPEDHRFVAQGPHGVEDERIVPMEKPSLDTKLGIKGAWKMTPRTSYDRAIYNPGNNIRHELSGDAYARKVIRKFRRLSRLLEPFSSWQENWDDREDDREKVYETQQRFIADAMPLVMEFASECGLLWGDYEPKSLSDWIKTCSEFRTIDLLARTLQKGSQRDRDEFRSRIGDERGWFQDGGGNLPLIRFEGRGLDFRTGKHSRVTLIQNGARDGYNAEDGSIVWTDLAEEFLSKPIDHQVWKVFAILVGRKLTDGFAVAPGDFMGADSGIVTTDLESLIYLRLWLDIKHHRPLPKHCQDCGTEIEDGNRKRLFCSDACKQRSYRNRSATQPHTLHT